MYSTFMFRNKLFVVNNLFDIPSYVHIYRLWDGKTIIHNAKFLLCFFQTVGYTNLQRLDLSYNLIFWIGLHAFSGLDKLVNLDISNNRLRFIPSDLFWDTPELQILDLSSNVFEKLKNEPFIMHNMLQVCIIIAHF